MEMTDLEGEIVRVRPDFPGGLCIIQGKLSRVTGYHNSANPMYQVRVLGQGVGVADVVFSLSQVKRVCEHDIYLK